MSFLRDYSAWQISLVIFLLLLVCIEVGYRFGLRSPPPSEVDSTTLGVIKGSVLALLGLLLGFSFALAAGRYEQRRQLMVQEANAIGTAYLRGDLMEEPLRTQYKEQLRGYTDARIEEFKAVAKLDASEWHRIHKAADLQNEIWKTGMTYVAGHPQSAGTILLVGSLNTLIDTGTERNVARLVEIPVPIFLLLLTTVLVSGLLVGHSFGTAKHRHRVITLLFSFLISVVVFINLDLDQPRRGLIQERQRIMEYLRSQLN